MHVLWHFLRASLLFFSITAKAAAGRKNLIIDTDLFSDCE